ncbi:LysR family transcriptional regulator [Rhodospirillaceae bacterium SYSU D60014]|uniref:LysR family transcriptional regulator n=1 Tax=Virgifigura deserti TaxID=2268457 RepID=UPI000E6634D0
MTSLIQIQAFLEVARSGSFAAAGRRLSLPRSTVSARVRALEERLNVRLLQRTTRRVALTEEGRRYMERCEEAIDSLAAAEAELARPHDLSGTIRITVPIDMSKRGLAEMLGAFADRHPATRIEILVTDEPLDLIADNIDLALRGGAAGSAGLVARKLGEGTLAFYASPQYVAERLPTRTLSNLSEHVIHDPARRLAGRSGARAQAGQIGTRNFELAKMLATRSRGIALLPEGICTGEVASGTLLRLSCEEPVPALPLYLVMPSRRHLPARVRAFIDFLTAPEVRSLIL